ncbi:protein arginine N-methyltransferase PRMT10 [Striga asiatica]|uniref:Protein arginine N-methyltransferase PRMT10 n=1 Tax=Striga asiatica TaxID=4170 RepID=A0A5A7P319_STRAF|nr:protein arginine N-methyltransferase PRMT10 [Striga asiatica]
MLEVMARGRFKNRWPTFLKITVIWSICGLTFFCLFKIALWSSSAPVDNNPNQPTVATDSYTYAEQRSILYAKMAKDLDEKGPVFLKQGETSQSLSLSDLFTLKSGILTPVLRAADPPVRANVLHLSTQFSVPISNTVNHTFSPYFDKDFFLAIWFQDPNIYHFSMFHASHHITPVEAEVRAVKDVADSICPIHIALNRVVLTSTGVLLGCWQVVSGVDPVTIRSKLKDALPRAPQKQLYDDAILHTSFARLLGSPKRCTEEEKKMSDIQMFHELVERLNNKIQGMKATVSELWYVEEYDLLALALNGKMKIQKFVFQMHEENWKV